MIGVVITSISARRHPPSGGAAQEHSGENIGSTESHALFVELKEPLPDPPETTTDLGPDSGS